MAILRKLNINGSEYNIGYSQNDLTDELKAKYDSAESGAVSKSALTITESAGTGNVLKTYTFTQNGAEVGKINIAKDLVVSGGEIVEKNGEKYLSLSIANQDAPVEIAVKDLVDVYTGSTYINITNGNVVELKLSDLDAALVAESAQVGAKLKANAEAAAAADAKGAQGIADAATEKGRAEGVEQALRADLGESGASAGTGSAFARIKQLESDISSLTGGSGSVSSQINNAISEYNTATVQPIASDVSIIKGDYLKASDKTELQNNINAKVSQSEYNTKVQAIEKSISDNVTAIGNNADAIDTMGQKLSGVSNNAKNVTASYEAETETLTISIL